MEKLDETLISKTKTIEELHLKIEDFENQVNAKTNEKIAELTKKLKAFAKARKELQAENEQFQEIDKTNSELSEFN